MLRVPHQKLGSGCLLGVLLLSLGLLGLGLLDGSLLDFGDLLDGGLGLGGNRLGDDLDDRNLCVVGDDDQSIYRFRGADIGNILNFEKIFNDAKVIRLEQNYRSTQTILDAANAVIANNQGRMRKTLWTQNGQGGKVTLKRIDTAQQEAYYIVDDITRLKRKGSFNYGQCAILYRTNAQSRALEEQLLMENVPYSQRIPGAVPPCHFWYCNDCICKCNIFVLAG